ncbi:MAG: XisI protein [Pseudomonadota bacterium]
MDNLENYRRIIQKLVKYHAQYVPSSGQIEVAPFIDTKHDNYGLIDVGWNHAGRVHSIIFHLRIEKGKIWVEWDGIETSVTQELVDAGIPKEDIVLGFHRPKRRAITGFSVA